MENQIALLVASHGVFAEEAINSLGMILGDVTNIDSVSLFPGMDLQDLVLDMEKAINNLVTKKGLIIICDIYGGTPSNAAAMILLKNKRKDFIAFSGLNLGILLELAHSRNSLEQVQKTIKESANLVWRQIEAPKINDMEEEL